MRLWKIRFINTTLEVEETWFGEEHSVMYAVSTYVNQGFHISSYETFTETNQEVAQV